MPIRRPMFLIFMVTMMMVLSLGLPAQAQQRVKTCPMVVSDSLTALGTNCANLSRNTSCLGHEAVKHTAFVGTVPAGFYTQAGDTAPLPQVETVQTGPFNLASEQWGLNVMNVDANVPYAAAPKGVIYIQFGGVEVENGVEPTDAVQLVNGINVSTKAATDLLTWPPPTIAGHKSESMLTIPSGATVSIDAVNPAPGDYARAVYQNHVGWVSRSALNESAVDLGGLPVIGPNSFTPMQSFYFRTGVGGTPCVDAPSLLFVQGPENVAVDLQVFQQPVRVESTIVLRSLPPGDQLGDTLELIVLSGLAVLYPDTDHAIFVPPGYKTTIPLCSEFASLGIEGDADEKATCGTWSDPIPLTQDEQGVCQSVEGVSDNLDYYGVTCPVTVQESCNGYCPPHLYFPDQNSLSEAIAACAAKELPDDICQYLGIS